MVVVILGSDWIFKMRAFVVLGVFALAVAVNAGAVSKGRKILLKHEARLCNYLKY